MVRLIALIVLALSAEYCIAEGCSGPSLLVRNQEWKCSKGEIPIRKFPSDSFEIRYKRCGYSNHVPPWDVKIYFENELIYHQKGSFTVTVLKFPDKMGHYSIIGTQFDHTIRWKFNILHEALPEFFILSEEHYNTDREASKPWKLEVFPTYFNDKIILKSDSDLITNIALLDLSGMIHFALEIHSDNYVLPTSNLPNKDYLLKVATFSGRVVLKRVVKAGF